jgi:predicted ester cyclase
MRQTFTIVVLSSIFCVFSAKGQSTEDNKKVIRHYLLEIVNDRKLDLLGEVFPEKFVRHDLNDSTDHWMTIVDQKKRLSILFDAFPDIHYTIGDIIAEGDKVVVRAVLQGTQKNTYREIESSGNRVNVSEIIFYRLENGKIVERWTQLDLHSLFKEMKGEK